MDRKTNSRTGDRNIPLWKKAAALGLGSATLLLTACGTNDTKADGPTGTSPVATSEATPSTSSSEISSGATSTTIEAPTSSETQTATPEVTKNPDGTVSFPVEAFEKNPAALGEAYYEAVTQWVNTGADLATVRAALDYASHNGGVKSGAVDTFYNKLVEENKVKWANALFGPNWQSSATISEYVNGMSKANLYTMQLYFLTGDSRNDTRDPSVTVSPIGQPGEYYQMTFQTAGDIQTDVNGQTVVDKVPYTQTDNLLKTNQVGNSSKDGSPYTPISAHGTETLAFTVNGINYIVGEIGSTAS